MSTNVTRNPPSPPPGLRDIEQAPSVMAKDDPVVARLIGMFAAALVIFGGAALLMQMYRGVAGVGAGWATIWLVLGVIGLLFHAVYDTDIQFRRLYMAFGYVSIAAGILLCCIGQFATGCMLLTLAVGFLLAFLRNETDQQFRDAAQLVLAIVGIVGAVIGLVGGHISPKMLWPDAPPPEAKMVRDIIWPYFFFLGLLGLVYLTACVGTRGISDNRSYRLGQFMGVLGALVFVLALARSVFPATFSRGDNPPSFFLPAGALLMLLGLLYLLTSLALTSDSAFVVLTRRELDAFFYSPVAYLVLFGFIVMHWFNYFLVIQFFHNRDQVEPVVGTFILQYWMILIVIFAIPALTMRLLSEELRTGTLEVMLTSPVDETVLVLSKFFAAFLLYLLMWLPFVLLMVSLRIGGGREFDYRPLLSFGMTVLVTGAGFIAMGVFCSSLSRNQIISAVLAFTGMLMLTLVFFLKREFSNRSEGKTTMLIAILDHASYIDLWINAINGQLVFRTLLFPLSMAIFFLFLTIKILEARKWK